MGFSNIQVLLTINFLYYFASGTTLPVFGHHLTKYGGTHLTIGSLAGLVVILGKISRDFVGLFEYSKRGAIIFCTCSALLSFLFIILYPAWFICYVARAYYGITMQVINISKEYVTATVAEEKKIKIYNLMDFVKTAGLCLGCILGGHIYLYTKRFTSNVTIASFAVSGAIYLAHHLEEDPRLEKPSDEPKRRLLALPSYCYQKLKHLGSVNYMSRWDVVILKIFYFLTFTIYFSRATFIMGYNYRVKTIIVGYFKFYGYLVSYFGGIFALFITESTESFTKKRKICKYCMFLSGVTLIALFYAPHYHGSLFFYLCVVFSYSIVNILVQQDALELKKDPEIDDAVNTINVITSIVSPFIFGVVCKTFGGKIFKIFSLIPAIVFMVLLHWSLTKNRERGKKSTTIREETDDDDLD